MCQGLRYHVDPEIRDWVREKGERDGERHLHLIWDKIGAAVRPPRPATPLVIIRPTALQDMAVPEQHWLVPDWIPWRRVTGIYGAGGEGKTLLLQQLMTAAALRQPWVGRRTFAVRSLGIFCEDDEQEMQRRQAAINQLYDATSAILARCIGRRGWGRTIC